MNNKERRFIKFYSNCILVKGAARACICDLQRGDIYPIPLSMMNLFDENGTCDISFWTEKFDKKSKSLLQYFAFLLKNELAFRCTEEELKFFPKLSEEWLYPALISNAVLDTCSEFDYVNKDFLKQLEALCCNQLQFRYFNEVGIDNLNNLLETISPSQIKSFEIILPESNRKSFYDEIEIIVSTHKKLSSLTVTGADKDGFFKHGHDGMGYILKTRKKIDSEVHCGVIGKGLFSVNIPTYTESLHYNSCLNRKIAIDSEGNIKNCPSMEETFGNIRDTTLIEAINKPGFRKYWNITKDLITKCKDCEFRHICTDCRAYLDEPENPYSAPLKCGYNPYTCEWEEWSTNPLKQQAIEHYGIKEIL